MAKYKLKLNLNDGSIIQTTNAIEIPSDSDLVHKGSSSSSVAEDIYGIKTFNDAVKFKATYTGEGGTTYTGYAKINTYLDTDYGTPYHPYLSFSDDSGNDNVHLAAYLFAGDTIIANNDLLTNSIMPRDPDNPVEIAGSANGVYSFPGGFSGTRNVATTTDLPQIVDLRS